MSTVTPIKRETSEKVLQVALREWISVGLNQRESKELEDIADTVAWIASRPAHVNVNLVELMPVAQSFGPFRVYRAAPKWGNPGTDRDSDSTE